MVNIVELVKEFIGLIRLYLYFLIVAKLKEVLDLIIKK